jgi:hypothetical protein
MPESAFAPPSDAELTATDRAAKLPGIWKLVGSASDGEFRSEPDDRAWEFREDGTGTESEADSVKQFRWSVDNQGLHRWTEHEDGWVYVFLRDGRLYMSDTGTQSWAVFKRE